MEFLIILLLVGAIALIVVPLVRKSGPRGADDTARGELLLTGVSPRPDATGEQYVTVTGVIKGPTVAEHVIYQQLAVDVDAWPTIGQLIPVDYSIKNPDNWRFAAEPVEPPQA